MRDRFGSDEWTERSESDLRTTMLFSNPESWEMLRRERPANVRLQSLRKIRKSVLLRTLPLRQRFRLLPGGMWGRED